MKTAREAHARGCHCMPVLDDDGNLVFTSRDDRCERFVAELTAAIEADRAELIEACARIFDDRLPEIDGDDIVSNKIVALCAARVRALKEPGR